MRSAKSFTLEPDINEYIASTKGEASASQRVNELLRTAMLKEKYEALEAEAAAFFAAVSNEEREETAAFRAASMRAISRGD
jgi:hypothetical protein